MRFQQKKPQKITDMEKDNDLLILAAKAAGVSLEDGWDPLNNQEHSDQLGILLRINVEWLIDTVNVHIIRKAHGVFMGGEPHEGTPKDMARALRLARVKVAAMKGKR